MYRLRGKEDLISDQFIFSISINSNANDTFSKFDVWFDQGVSESMVGVAVSRQGQA